MAQDTDYVGLLPKIFLVDKARVIGDESVGEVFQIPASGQVPLGDIGALARHFAQFVSKPTGDTQVVDDFDPTIYKIQEQNGKVNYVVRVRSTKDQMGETKAVAVIQQVIDCDHKGTFRAYLRELNPQSK